MKSNIYLFFLIFLFANPTIAQIVAESPNLSLLDTTNLDSEHKVRQLYKSIKTLSDGLAADTIVLYYEKALKAAQILPNDTLVHKIALYIAEIHAQNNDFQASLAFKELALDHALKCKLKPFIANAYNELGVQYLDEQQTIKGIDAFLKVLENEDNSTRTQAIKNSAINNLSYCYFILGELEESIYYLKLNERYYLDQSMEKRIQPLILNYTGMVECYSNLGEADSSKFYLKKLIKMVELLEQDTFTSINDKKTISDTYFNITDRYLSLGNMEQAQRFYSKSNELKHYNKYKKYLLDLKFAVNSNQLPIAQELIENPPEKLKNVIGDLTYYEIVADYYAKVKNYEKSLYYTTLYKNQEIEDLTSRQLALSAYTKSRLESVNYKNSLAIIEKEHKIQSTRSLLAYGLIALLFIFSGLLYYAYRQIRSKNKYLNRDLANKKIIEKQSKLLQESVLQKNKLFTNIAHELQTPLNIIQGLGTEIVKNENLTEVGYESLGIMLKNSAYLSKTTQEILSLNLDQSKSKVTNFVLFSFSDLIQNLIPEYQFLASAKSIKLVLPAIEEQTPILMYSDIEKIGTILKNLLSNAIKNTDAEGIVSIVYHSTDLTHEIKVSDTGQGIASKDLPAIFDRYFQSSDGKVAGGFGIGLAICKEYITALKGTVKVDSVLGEGTTFTVQFPKADKSVLTSPEKKLFSFPKLIEIPTRALNTPIDTTISNTQTELLIVEDNLDFCRFLALILEKDYHLVFVHNGQQAIDYLKEKTAALIITDWMMPIMDGFDLVTFLKNSEEYNQIPVLMLTARSMISDKLKALRVGIDDYLIKPIEGEVLKSQISNLLNSLEQRQESNLAFPYVNSNTAKLSLSASDQNWLMRIEESVLPLIGDFNLNLEQVAQANRTNIKQLSLKIKAITGLTAKKYIQEIRYWEARKMLEVGQHDSVKMVALMVGFKDTKNFARRFKERFGKYPSEYLVK